MNYKFIFSAKSIIERDALISFLAQNQIEALSPQRDISRKYTEHTFDYSYGAYSTVFDGFKVFVDVKDFDQAMDCLKEFSTQKEKNFRLNLVEQKNYVSKFYYFSISSFFIPLLPTVFGLYYFYKAVQNKEKFKMSYTIFSFIIYGVTLFVSVYVSLEKLIEYNWIKL